MVNKNSADYKLNKNLANQGDRMMMVTTILIYIYIYAENSRELGVSSSIQLSSCCLFFSETMLTSNLPLYC